MAKKALKGLSYEQQDTFYDFLLHCYRRGLKLKVALEAARKVFVKWNVPKFSAYYGKFNKKDFSYKRKVGTLRGAPKQCAALSKEAKAARDAGDYEEELRLKKSMRSAAGKSAALGEEAKAARDAGDYKEELRLKKMMPGVAGEFATLGEKVKAARDAGDYEEELRLKKTMRGAGGFNAALGEKIKIAKEAGDYEEALRLNKLMIGAASKSTVLHGTLKNSFFTTECSKVVVSTSKRRILMPNFSNDSIKLPLSVKREEPNFSAKKRRILMPTIFKQ